MVVIRQIRALFALVAVGWIIPIEAFGSDARRAVRPVMNNDQQRAQLAEQAVAGSAWITYDLEADAPLALKEERRAKFRFRLVVELGNQSAKRALDLVASVQDDDVGDLKR